MRVLNQLNSEILILYSCHLNTTLPTIMLGITAADTY